MTFFQKLVTAVNSVISINIKGYEVDKDHICSGGPGGLWKCKNRYIYQKYKKIFTVYNANKGDKQKIKATAFIF